MAIADRSALPAPVRTGLERLDADGIYFAPVRHHSPACALALRQLIREVRPAAVLIEGPDEFDQLLPLLLDARTRPPVAVLSQSTDPSDAATALRSVFFPFCDYSPEWVALHEAAAVGAQIAFIDRPWHALPAPAEADDEARSLMSERYLAHSDYLKRLAARSGCRDQDELWDHLFELRPAAALRDWRSLFADVFCYCAMARLDYETQVLEADGSLPRERHMAAHLRHWRAKVTGPIVVVTGGFHTIALQQMLDAPAPMPAPVQAPRAAASTTPQSGNWLIRYSFDRLNALNGYAAGMPSPAYYQWVWDSASASPHGPALQEVAADCLTRLARHSRQLGLVEQVSTADVQTAVVHACRIADLRGHAGPGRQDLLDAVRSCFIKGAIDDGTSGMAADIHRFFGGNLLGDVPPSAGSPPLLEDARRSAHRMGFRLDDSLPRNVRLDIYRKEKHRACSRFLHLMTYLGTGVGEWQSGPDFMANTRLELLTEEWRVGWSPLVEARLIELAPTGTTLIDAAMACLRSEEAALGAQGKARNAAHAVRLLTRACVIGLHQRIASLLAMLAVHLEEDANPISMIVCGHRLLILWRASEPLGVQDHDQLRALLLRAWSGALYLLPQLADADANAEAAAIDGMLSLRALHHALRVMDDDVLAGEPSAWHQQLESIVAARGAASGVCSAAATLLFLDGAWNEDRLGALLANSFGPGAEADQAVRALKGMMAAAPELLVTQAGLRQQVNAILGRWDEHTFISYLPDLRHAFAQLKPQETATLAEALAGMSAGAETSLAQTHYAATEADLLAGATLQAALADCLVRDGLERWARPPAAQA